MVEEAVLAQEKKKKKKKMPKRQDIFCMFHFSHLQRMFPLFDDPMYYLWESSCTQINFNEHKA
jgi:hypothetical protein